MRVCEAREGAAGVPRLDPAGRSGAGQGRGGWWRRAQLAARARLPAGSWSAGAPAGDGGGQPEGASEVPGSGGEEVEREKGSRRFNSLGGKESGTLQLCLKCQCNLSLPHWVIGSLHGFCKCSLEWCS